MSKQANNWDERDYKLWSKIQALRNYGLVAGDKHNPLIFLDDVVTCMKSEAELRAVPAEPEAAREDRDRRIDVLLEACTASLIEHIGSHEVMMLDPKMRGIKEPAIIEQLQNAINLLRAPGPAERAPEADTTCEQCGKEFSHTQTNAVARFDFCSTGCEEKYKSGVPEAIPAEPLKEKTDARQ